MRPSNHVRPAACWRREILPDGVGPDKLSERVTGMLEEVADVVEKVKPDCRRGALGRRMFSLRFQKWCLGAANK